jgi:hypothetical protein
VIFKKDVNINYAAPNVYRLGDINKDGYDDILIYDCSQQTAMIFLGGSPMDTIPRYTIHFNDTLPRFGGVAALDINGDGVNDIVISTGKYEGGYPKPGDIRIFYGGSTIDTIPNLIFNPPPGASGGGLYVLHDFNGDGRSELVIYDPHLPFASVYANYGINYFYNTGTVFDTIPEYTIQGDSLRGIQIDGIYSSGDINGDGKKDFIINCSDSSGGRYKYFTKVFLGNSNFNLNPAVTYYQDSVGFGRMYIVRDLNGDGKDDFLMSAYDNIYPYYYCNSILWGSFPIDTIQDVGLNTQNDVISDITDAGDINGDGKNDLFVRMSGGLGYPNVKIWLGGKQMPYKIDDVADKTWYGGEEGFGRQIAAVGDVNGDGVDDICIMKVGYGDPIDCKLGTVYIIKGDTSAKGDTATSVNDNKNILPKSYILEEPYPNPFNPSTVISYQLSAISFITLKVYDLSGREIIQLLNAEQTAGKHRIEFNAEKYKLSSGVYIIQMQASVKNKILFSQTKKLTLIK